MRHFTLVSLALALTATVVPTLATAAEDVVVVYDGSGSMWGQIDGVAKVEIARDVMGDLVAEWPDGANVGLMAYGHRTQGDCGDIETVIAPAPLDRSAFIAGVNAVTPRGRTPLTEAVRQAAELLSYRDRPATVILISDGLETCEADPCALSAQLAQQGVNFTAHVVGFDLTEEEHAGLACIAENTGGMFVPAQDADSLRQALGNVQEAMNLTPVTQDVVVDVPAPQQEIVADITLESPTTIVTGTSFVVSWSSSVHRQDYVTIVPAGADAGTYTNYQRVREDTQNSLISPAEPGFYEVRYVLNETKQTLASVSVEVVAPEMSIAAPDQVTTGANFSVSWSSSIHPQDYVTIVPVGAEEGAYTNYQRVRATTENTLTAPAEPGLYQVRYVLNEGKRTLASDPVEVVAADVTIAAPEQITTGARFSVSWSSSIHPQDYVTIVPIGADEGIYTNYQRVRNDTESHLTALAEPGLYEVRYVMNEGSQTLATTSVEVIAAEVTLTGPDIVRVESPIRIDWSKSIHPQDYITIVPAGSEEGTYHEYMRVRDTLQGDLNAPADPGFYEIRYVLQQGDRTISSQMLEVVAADAPLDDGAGLVVPSNASPGESVSVSWTGGGDSADQRITLARANQADFSWIEAHRVGDETMLEFTMPDEPGRYEVRYLDIAGQVVLGRAILEVE